MNTLKTLVFLFGFLPAMLFAAEPAVKSTEPLAQDPDAKTFPPTTQIATFGGGCFWCSEEVLHQLPGVLSVVSGYMGGSEEEANYESVSTGRTGHAEVVQVHFDPARVSYETLLDQFFASHDPTQLNAQGPDRGTQYRSAIFYYDPSQRNTATTKIRQLNEVKRFPGAIVTEVSPAQPFYPAEDYHQNFARKNPSNPYLENHLYPKMGKLGLELPEGGENKSLLRRLFFP
jgi:peptide-methionine (S)-S-oxide reductase